MLGFLAFTLGPIVASFGLMFTDWTVIRPLNFVGLENFRRLIEDDVFWTALRNTMLYVVLYVPTVTVGAFFLAVLMDRKLQGIGIYRTIYFMPSVCSFVAMSLVWQFLYQPSTVFAYQLSLLGISSPNFLGDQRWAMVGIAILGIWRHIGYFALIYLAGLQAVPTDLYEAASVDGASAWTRLVKITVPLVSPTTFFVLVIAFIEAFQLFGEPYVMTKGGPGLRHDDAGLLDLSERLRGVQDGVRRDAVLGAVRVDLRRHHHSVAAESGPKSWLRQLARCHGDPPAASGRTGSCSTA